LPNDRELWERIVNGDAASFDAFYRENAPGLQGFLRQIVGNPQAAEDVAQETFTRYGTGPTGSNRSAELSAPIFTELEGNEPPTGGGSKARRSKKKKARRILAIPKPRRLLGTHSNGFRRSNGTCCGCERWKANPTRNWQRFWRFRSAQSDRDCSQPARPCERSGEAHIKL
jgi:hypothetical protein